MSTLVSSCRLAMRAGACGFACLDMEGGNFGYWEVRNIGRIVGMRTLVLSRRRMNWKFDFSPETSDIVAVDERCYCWRREYNQIKGVRGFWQVRATCQARANSAKPGLGGAFPLMLFTSALQIRASY
jgi:hypothetical protein